MRLPYAESLTILSRTVSGQDGDGNDVYSTVEVAAKGAFAPQGTVELVQGQATVLTHDTVYLDEGSPVPDPQDRVRRESTGVVYDVDGTPRTYVNPFTGHNPGAVLALLEVTG